MVHCYEVASIATVRVSMSANPGSRTQSPCGSDRTSRLNLCPRCQFDVLLGGGERRHPKDGMGGERWERNIIQRSRGCLHVYYIYLHIES